MASLAAFLKDLLVGLFESIYNLLADFGQALIDVLPEFFQSLVGLITYACPAPPLDFQQSTASGAGGQLFSAVLSMILQTLNWILPLQFFVYLLQWIVCGMTGYIAVMVIARWSKLLT